MTDVPTERVPTVREADEQFASLRGFHRLRWQAALIASIILASAVAALAVVVVEQSGVISRQTQEIARQQAEIQSTCLFYSSLVAAGQELKPTPPSKVPSKLAIELIIGSRRAYVREGCSAVPLPPLPARVMQWAREDHLPSS